MEGINYHSSMGVFIREENQAPTLVIFPFIVLVYEMMKSGTTSIPMKRWSRILANERVDLRIKEMNYVHERL